MLDSRRLSKGFAMSTNDRMSPVGKAVHRGNWAYLQQRINKWFDLSLTETEVREMLSDDVETIKKDGNAFGIQWTDATWLMWIKNRIEFPHGCDQCEDYTRNEFNVFFITIPETDRMILRLKEGLG